jgi:hypothetical protein
MFVYGILVHAYFYRDCIGYEPEIRRALNYIETELPSDTEALLRVEYIRMELDLEYGRYDAVQERLLPYLAQAEVAHAYRKADGCRVGHLLNYATGDFAKAREYAELNAQYSYEGQHQRGVADALLWQAVYTLKSGDTGEAQRILQQGLNHYQRFNLAPALTYFDALCAYSEETGHAEKARNMRQQQFADLEARGSLHELARAHLQYARLLGRMKQPMDDALSKARIFITTLRKPDIYLEALQHIENGNYYEFDWQRDNTNH